MVKEPKKVGVGKWVAGILASIIAAIIVGWLTQLGPFKPPADLQITHSSVEPTHPWFSTNEVMAQFAARAKLVVFNDGGSTAKNCRAFWEAPTRKGEPWIFSVSPERFNVPPKQSLEIIIKGGFHQPSRDSEGRYPIQKVNTIGGVIYDQMKITSSREIIVHPNPRPK